MLWSDTYKVNEQIIDGQHKRLFEFIALLQNKKNMKKKMMMVPLNYLQNYAASHFRYEEGVMEKINYPDIVEHKKLHANFEKKVEELIKEVEACGEIVPEELVDSIFNYLHDWLVAHIITVDNKYSKFL